MRVDSKMHEVVDRAVVRPRAAVKPLVFQCAPFLSIMKGRSVESRSTPPQDKRQLDIPEVSLGVVLLQGPAGSCGLVLDSHSPNSNPLILNPKVRNWIPDAQSPYGQRICCIRAEIPESPIANLSI